jgi:uncharacterized protein (DUF1778 family)
MSPKEKPEPQRNKPVQLGLRVSEHAKDLLARIADANGFNLTHALEYCIRQTAKAEGVWNIGDTGKKDRR